MSDKKIKKDLTEIYKRWSGAEPEKIENMPAHGSDRRYYRIFGNQKTAIGVYNPDLKENIAFLTFSKHFLKHKLF